MTNGRIKAFIRLLVAVILMVNGWLTATGKNPIPFNESAFTEYASYIAEGLVVVWVWWKNNNVTKKAQAIQEAGKAAVESK